VVPDSVVGLLVLVVAVLPGLVYTLAFERQAGAYGVTLADRTLRFIGVSAIFHIIVGWPEYWLYRVVLHGGQRVLTAQFAALWLAGVAALVGPAVAGTALGRLYGSRRARPRWQQRMVALLTGPDLEPRAWDAFFSERPTTYLRVLMPDGKMVGGLFASRSYAAGFPQDPDLLLEQAWSVNPATGELEAPLGYPLYVPAGQIRLMEIVRPQGVAEQGGASAGQREGD